MRRAARESSRKYGFMNQQGTKQLQEFREQIGASRAQETLDRFVLARSKLGQDGFVHLLVVFVPRPPLALRAPVFVAILSDSSSSAGVLRRCLPKAPATWLLAGNSAYASRARSSFWAEDFSPCFCECCSPMGSPLSNCSAIFLLFPFFGFLIALTLRRLHPERYRCSVARQLPAAPRTVC